MSRKKSMICAALGSAFVSGIGMASIATAADNPFVTQPLERGYMVADAHGAAAKAGDGKCGGEGKCGSKHADKHCGAAMADENKDGKVSKEEFVKHHDGMFDHMDTNKDGFVDKDEMKKAREGKRSKMKDGACG